MCKNDSCNHRPGETTRRSVIGIVGTSAVTAVAGCLGGTETERGPTPDPIALSGGKQCDVCGMVIGDHAGPNGQIFYSDHSPEAHENPAWFDSIKACMLPYYYQQKRRDWESRVLYATDYSTVDYTISTRGGTKYISSHLEAGTFSKAAEMRYVVESSVHGAMGADFIPFTDQADSESFVESHGGRIVAFDEITPELVGQ